MPYISISTSETLSKQQKDSLKAELGKHISVIPGKSEGVLMVEIRDGNTMYFRGAETPCAFVEVRLYTEAPMDAKKDFAEKLFQAMEQTTGVPAKEIFLNINEFDHWGSGGSFR